MSKEELHKMLMSQFSELHVLPDHLQERFKNIDQEIKEYTEVMPTVRAACDTALDNAGVEVSLDDRAEFARNVQKRINTTAHFFAYSNKEESNS